MTAPYHPYPEGTRVRGVYDADGESGLVGSAKVIRAWWRERELPRMAVAMVTLRFDGNATPCAYDGPVALNVLGLAPAHDAKNGAVRK